MAPLKSPTVPSSVNRGDACVRLKNVVIPCFYSFLPTKELVTYRVMFSHLKEAMGENFPSVFHVDYEQAVLRYISQDAEKKAEGYLVG